MNERKSFSVGLLLIVLLGASPAFAQSTPSMNLEGQGLIAFSNNPMCSATSCAGQLRMGVSGVLGQQNIQNLNFTLNFEVPFFAPSTSADATASAAAKKPKKPTLEQQIEALQAQVGMLLPHGCLPASGTGTSSDGAYTITLDGQFCMPNGGVEVLSGAMTIVSTAPALSPPYDVPWASGTLEASGWPHCCGGEYVPHLSNEIIVSIVGALGQEYEGPTP